MMKRITLLLCLLCCLGASAQQQLLPYQDTRLSAEERAKDLCARLTPAEKVKLMVHRSPAIERLGIPQFEWWNEALHGLARAGTLGGGYATVFPITMGMAATFDDGLVGRIFEAVSDEARAQNTRARREGRMEQYYGLSFYTPNINIFRDPRWGRGQETYGEDPFLTTRMGLAVVRGLQGDKSHEKYYKALACAKHYAVHSGPEGTRHRFDVEKVSTRDLYETYLPAFKALVQKGKVAEVMCAYNRLEGVPCCGSERLLQQILRREWGFEGIVTSDCWAINDFWGSWRHDYAADREDAARKAIEAGTDLDCGGSEYNTLVNFLATGELAEEVDRSLCKLLKFRFELGDFDPDSLVRWTQIPASVIASEPHKRLAHEAACQSMVLLQNKRDILPLAKDIQGLVVTGPNAADSIMQRGNYEGKPTHTITILDGIRSKLGREVPYIESCGLTDDGAGDYLSQMADAKVVIFVGGLSPKLEGEELDVEIDGFIKGDRTHIELPAPQRKVIESLHRAGKKVIFVCCSGSAIAMVPETENAEAIVQAWYPGEDGGAVADVLFGDFNPCGKLPVTFYARTSQLPPFEDYSMKGRTYRYFAGKPLFPFGHGLSYTRFDYGKAAYAGGELQISLQNKGRREGTEVVQVYFKRNDDKEGPLKTLCAYKRVTLQPGGSSTVSFRIPQEDMETWDAETNTMRFVPGSYTFMIGGSSADAEKHRIVVEL